MKPLFIPLYAEYYKRFKEGTKTEELRKYGPRWNEKTCIPERKVILSKGYGKQNRLAGNISYFKKLRAKELKGQHKIDIEALNLLDSYIAVIGIKNIEIQGLKRINRK